MISKNKSLLNSQLYLVLDKDSCPKGDVINILRKIGKVGVDLVQLRENTSCDRDFLKDAKIIKRLCRKQGIIFLVNNRLDIAQIVDADGLHLGQSDLSLKTAREILGKNKIIGASCRNLIQASRAQDEGADYISIGPVFPTLTKPNLNPINPKLISAVNQKVNLPIFAIGGINRANITRVISYGAKRFALCRAICRAQNVKKAAGELKNIIYDYAD